MGHLPLAFSVHHFIDSVGSDAGFASIIGLAILVLLYFAHARETAALRSQAEESSQRMQELEATVARLGQTVRQPAGVAALPKQAPAPAVVRPLASAAAGAQAAGAGSGVAGTPAPASAAGMAAAGATAYAGQTAPAPPAGVGAPPLSAATRLIPTAGLDAPVEASTSAPPAAIAGPSSAAPPAGTNGTGEHAVPAPAPPARKTVQVRPGAGAGAPRVGGAPPLRTAPARSGPSSRRTRWLTGGLVGLALVAIVAVLLIVTSNGGGTKSAGTVSTPTSNAPTAVKHHHATAARAKPIKNSSVTVAVLNGTPIDQLAHRTAVKLVADGFKQGVVTGASDQTHTATIVAYLPGQQAAALVVAKALGLGSASVQAVDSGTQAVACPPPAACAADVVVTLGSDLATQ